MKVKRIVAILCLAVMMMGAVSTAFAATPTVTITSASKNQRVKRGKTVKFVYKLKSNSYTRMSGYYRAGFGSYVYRGTDKNDQYASKEVYFTGNIKYTLRWKTSKYYPTGKYTNLYGTVYRYSIYSDNWYASSAKTTKIYLK